MAAKWLHPVDPDCPEVSEFKSTLLNDPMSEHAPVDEIIEGWERKHLQNCKRCQDYAAANIDIE